VDLRVAPTSLAVRSDPILLERTLRNLIGNAVHYTETGRVLVGARRNGAGLVNLEVWDTGPGIAETEREAIFEEFYQLSNPDPRQGQGPGPGPRHCATPLRDPWPRTPSGSRPGRGSLFRLTVTRARPLTRWPDLSRPKPSNCPIRALA